MPHTEAVEEARYYVEQALKEERKQVDTIGNELDPEQEKEIEECNVGDDEIHPDFQHVNPDGLEFETNVF